jgi:hypothetical protein
MFPLPCVCDRLPCIMIIPTCSSNFPLNNKTENILSDFILHGAKAPRQPRPPHYQRFTITLGRTLQDKCSTKCRDHYPIICSTHKRYLCMGAIQTHNPRRQPPATPLRRTHCNWVQPSRLITSSNSLMSVNYPWLLQTPLLIMSDCPDYYAVLSPLPTPEWHFWQTCLQLLWLVAQQMRVFCHWLTNSSFYT